jgi:hypothetical protein
VGLGDRGKTRPLIFFSFSATSDRSNPAVG